MLRAPGLRLHTDVDRIARSTTVDWDELIARSRELDVTHAVYFSLELSATLLDAPVPAYVREALAPPAWKINVMSRWLNHVDLFEPDERKFTRPAMMAFAALLYDDAAGLLASVFDTDRSRLGPAHLGTKLRAGARRLRDVMSRYQS